MNVTLPQFDETNLVSAPAAIRLDNVSRHFAPAAGGLPVAALSNVSFALAPGSITGLAGASGAGKSTLLDILGRRTQPTLGSVTIEGFSRDRIGVVPQEADLRASRTVLENVLLPLESGATALWEATLKARALLERLGLEQSETRFPRELSAGERQRVAIARALITDPDLLLLDEPIATLDRSSADTVLGVIEEARTTRGATIVIASRHPVSLKDIVDDIIVLQQGRVVESGPAYGLLTRPRSEAARALIGSAFSANLPAFLQERLIEEPSTTGQAIVRLIFTGNSATTPVITRLARDLGLDANILLGSAETVRGKLYGMLIVGVASGEPYLSAALDHFQDAGLETEVLGFID